MDKGYKTLLTEANAVVKTYAVQEAIAQLSSGNVLFVDLRDHPELATEGKIPGAVHVTRGMLEFRVDPDSPYYDPAFDAGKEILFYCASGGRSALAAKTAQEMGLRSVAHIGGGMKAWKEAGGAVEAAI